MIYIERYLYQVTSKDRKVLRNIGARIAEIGNLPIMDDRRRLWKKLNALEAERPMILCEMCGVMDEIVPLNTLECEGEWSREIERSLKSKIFHFENVCDDMIIEPRITYNYKVNISNFGVASVMHSGSYADILGSYRWDPPITNIEEGIKKLHFRELSVDLDTTITNKSLLEDVFYDILKVEHRGWYFWTQGLTNTLILNMIGLEGLMYAMYDQPEQLHILMSFLRDEQISFLKWHEEQGLLISNNQDDYIGSGGCGYTDLLPQKDYILGERVRLKDMWGLSESQETVGVSSDMFEEFVFQYQLPVISLFGFACYGCCEPIESRWHIIKHIPNLRRVSVSPWSNQEKMAEYLSNNYIYSRKPNPTLVSTDIWDEELIHNDIRRTLDITRGLNVEIVLKDVHTLKKDSARMGKWVCIAREELENMG